MSRCFPFPPPGYEKKIRTDETDPLVKEKNKEKKHKKDKEKKESKEKKSKDRSKDKQKERKEKKEKHKGRKDKEKDKEKHKPLEEKKAEVLTINGHSEKLVTNTVQNHCNGESKYVQDLARRIRYEEEATGSQTAPEISYPHQKNLGTTGKESENSSFYPIQETNHRDDEDKRINTQKKFSVVKSAENAVAGVSFGADQKRAEAMGKPMESRDQVRQTESPEKRHRKESVSKSDKPRDKEGVKKNEASDRDRNKEKKEEKMESINKTHQEKTKLIGGPKVGEREKDSLDCKPPDVSRESAKNLIPQGNLGKRKDHETNGFLYENGSTPYKLQRHSASVSSVENGRTLGSHRTPPMPACEVQRAACKPEVKEVRINGKPEVKEVRINGFVVSGEKQKVCPPNALAATMKVKVKENGEASARPPHPDLKYLNQILNVPQRDLLLVVDDDEEWLFGQSLKKARTESPDSGESLQVWNKALNIESADIVALPYVVPF